MVAQNLDTTANRYSPVSCPPPAVPIRARAPWKEPGEMVAIWMFPKIGGFFPQNGWFISWKTLLKWMIWGGFPYFWKHPYVNAPENIIRSNEHEVRIRFFRIRSFFRKIMLFLTPSNFFFNHNWTLQWGAKWLLKGTIFKTFVTCHEILISLFHIKTEYNPSINVYYNLGVAPPITMANEGL